MNKTITSAASKMAYKVLHMKKSTKIAIGVTTAASAAAAGTIAFKARQAKKQERSIKSLMMEDAIKRLPKPRPIEDTYEEALKQSAQPYCLPDFARKSIGFTELDEFTDTFILEPKEEYSDFVIFYIHGHNFWADPAKMQFRFCRSLADTLGAKLVLPVYPKAPTHHVVEVHEMLLERYLYLVNEKGIDPKNIVFAGDAAGGGLALSLLQRIRYQALPMPKQAILLSPWLDISNTNIEMEALQKDDPMLNIERLRFQGKEYAGDVGVESPVVSPLNGDLKGLPPISVFSGTHDILSADAVELEKLAIEQELDINVYLFANQVHFFAALPIPEAKEALELIAEDVFGVEDEDIEEEYPDEEAFEEEVLEELDALDTDPAEEIIIEADEAE